MESNKSLIEEIVNDQLVALQVVSSTRLLDPDELAILKTCIASQQKVRGEDLSALSDEQLLKLIK